MRFAFVGVEKANYPVRLLCRVLKVSTSGFYAWQRRRPSQRQRLDAQLLVKVTAIHASSRKSYGSPRIHRELRANGDRISRKRVARLMSQNGLDGRRKRRFCKTTNSAHKMPVAENILARNFTIGTKNTVWVGDISYIHTWEGWLYLAVLIDLHSRRVVGWAIDDTMCTALPLKALTMAIGHRHPCAGLIHHSDRGSQYASHDYQAALKDNHMVCSMSRKGECWDNAVAESFFGRLKEELIYRRSWQTRAEAKAAIIEYILCFYNCHRRHSALGYLSPMAYEEIIGAERLAA